MAYYPDDDGNLICDDCWYGCDGTPCPQVHCKHTCHPESHRYPPGALMDHARRLSRDFIFATAARRAAELDDRPEPALANLARDLEAEARPDVDALMVERFGRPTRSRA